MSRAPHAVRVERYPNGEPMTEPRCLVLYAGTHGHARRIADAIADRLRMSDLSVDVADVRTQPADPRGYDLVVVGGSVHFGRHHRALRRWLARQSTTLNAMPCAVFSVSLTAAGRTEEKLAAARGYVDALVRKTGVVPTSRVVFGGALQYREYGPLVRALMRRIAAAQGLPTDVSTDVDLTDWQAVDAFADEARSLLRVPTTV